MAPSPPSDPDSRADRQLVAACAEIGLHSTRPDGYCQTCGVPGPCARRETAVKIFSRYHRQPRRPNARFGLPPVGLPG